MKIHNGQKIRLLAINRDITWENNIFATNQKDHPHPPCNGQ